MKSILFVENDDLLREIVTDSLRLCNVENVVNAVNSGETRLEILKQQRFDLIITDLCLEKMDGLALLSCLREYQVKTPSIVITGKNTAGLEPLVRSLGALAFFHKPFDLSVLLVTVERFLLTSSDGMENRINGFTLQVFCS